MKLFDLISLTRIELNQSLNFKKNIVLENLKLVKMHLNWKKGLWSNRVDQNPVCGILVFRSTGRVRSGRPDLARKRKKNRAVEKCKVAFWPPPVPFSALLPLGTSQHILVSHTTQFQAILERESSERR